jgi:hypothetical protein
MPAVAISNGVARHQLPQIPKEEIPEFIRYVQTLSIPDGRNDYNVGVTSDVAVTAAKLPAKALKPIQKAVDKEKVRGMVQNFDQIKNDVLIVSQDNQILDGHHRWLAIMEKDPKHLMRVIRVQLPIKVLVQAAHDFEGSHIRKLGEMIKLVKLLPQGL